MQKLVLILFVFIANTCLAQSKLNERFVNRKADTTFVKELILFTQNEKDSASQLLHEVYGLTVSEEIKDKTGLSFFNYRLALKAIDRKYWYRAERYLKSAAKDLTTEPILKSINDELLNCYDALGNNENKADLLFNLFETEKNEGYYVELKKLSIQNKLNADLQSKLLRVSLAKNDHLFIARCLMQSGLKDSAMVYINKVLDTANNARTIIDVAESKLMYAMIYRESNDVKKAQLLIGQSISIIDSIKNYNLLSEALTEYGKICFAQKQIPASIAAFNKSLNYARLSKDDLILKTQLTFMVNFYNAIGNTGMAKAYGDSLSIVSIGLPAKLSEKELFSQYLNFEDTIQECYKQLAKKQEVKPDSILNLNTMFLLIGILLILIIVFIFIYLKKQPKIVKEEVIIEKELPAKEIIREVLVEVKNDGVNQNLLKVFNGLNVNTQLISKVFRNSFVTETTSLNQFVWLADLRLSRTAPIRGVFVALADNMQIGENAAILNIQLNDYLNKIIKEKNIMQPSAILNHLNRAVNEFSEVNKTLWKNKIAFCFINADNTELLFAGAALNINIIRNAKVYDIKANDVIIGDANPDFQFQDNSVAITKGDVIIMSDCLDNEKMQEITSIITEYSKNSNYNTLVEIESILKNSIFKCCVMYI